MTHKELSEPVLGLREPERPLTRLLKTVFTFTLAQPISPHEPRQNGSLYVSNRRKYKVSTYFVRNRQRVTTLGYSVFKTSQAMSAWRDLPKAG